MKERKLQKDASHVIPFLFFKTRATVMVTTDAHSCRGRGRDLGAGGWGAALQQAQWARGGVTGRRAGSERAGQWDRGAGRSRGIRSSDGHSRARIGKNLKQPSAPAEQAAQAWGGNVEAGRAASGQARGLRVCWVLCGHSEELDAAPCGRSAPVCPECSAMVSGISKSLG